MASTVAWTLVQDLCLGLQSKFISERLETEVSTTISGTKVPATFTGQPNVSHKLAYRFRQPSYRDEWL